jgi:nicotinamide-nucleotide amidase
VRAEIVSVGTELLLGQIVDTNAAWLAERLAPLGIDLYWISQVGDNLGRLTEVFERALRRSDLTIVTGGLGPTEDDLTREAIAAVLGEQMTVVPELEADLRAFFARRGVPMPARNIKQATIIPSGRPLRNPIGTAPGWWVERDDHVIVAMPGVPHEMRRMWQEEVLPILRQRMGTAAIVSRTLKVLGPGESAVEEMLQHLLASPNPTVATYAKPDGVHVRVTAKGSSDDEARALVAAMEAEVRAALGHHIYGVDDETIAEVVSRLLLERDLTVATIEAASGGMLASVIAEAALSAQVYRGGLIVGASGLAPLGAAEFGARDGHDTTSAAAAALLARVARERFGADLGLAITGAPGPTASGETPPGTVHVAMAWHGEPHVNTQQHRTTPTEVRRRAAMAALNLVRRTLLESATRA